MGRKKGFTLIEVVIAVVIVGILAAATVGYISGIQERAKAMQAIGIAAIVKATAKTAFSKNAGSDMATGPGNAYFLSVMTGYYTNAVSSLNPNTPPYCWPYGIYAGHDCLGVQIFCCSAPNRKEWLCYAYFFTNGKTKWYINPNTPLTAALKSLIPPEDEILGAQL